MNTIKTGQTLTARSICDSDCVFVAEVVERKGAFAIVKTMGQVKRVKVHSNADGEFLYALGRYSMSPTFRA